MRHKYETRGIVLSRTSLGEANSLVVLITPELGLVRARAQGLRRPGAKLASALVTFAESDVILVRGKEGWRIAGAVLAENWFTRMRGTIQRKRASRVSGLCLQLIAGEMHDPRMFQIMNGFFKALTELPENSHECIEVLAALRIVAALGLDAGELPGEAALFTQPLLAAVAENRITYISRINHGISISGL